MKTLIKTSIISLSILFSGAASAHIVDRFESIETFPEESIQKSTINHIVEYKQIIVANPKYYELFKNGMLAKEGDDTVVYIGGEEEPIVSEKTKLNDGVFQTIAVMRSSEEDIHRWCKDFKLMGQDEYLKAVSKQEFHSSIMYNKNCVSHYKNHGYSIATNKFTVIQRS